MSIDDRAIGVEIRHTGAPPEVELEVVHFAGRDVVLIQDDGTERVYDAEELRKALEIPEDIDAQDCPHCDSRGRWKDPNGIERRCGYCGGIGRLAA